MGLIDFLRRENAVVGWSWRIVGAALAGLLTLFALTSEDARTAIFRLDTLAIDAWQRASGQDEPSGEIIVVGLDAEAISRHGRWPWPRAVLSELVEKIAAAGAKSLALDILLTEHGPYSDRSLIPVFRQNTPEATALRGPDPDARLAEALTLIPSALAVAVGVPEDFDLSRPQVSCADQEMLANSPRRYYVECLFYPLDAFYNVASDAATRTDKDLDGVVRRGRAMVAQPNIDPQSRQPAEFLMPAFPVATLIACGGVDPSCPQLASTVEDLTGGDVNSWTGLKLSLARGEGAALPALPLTPDFSFWLDFGALSALSAPRGEIVRTPHSVVSAAAIMADDEAELARIKGKHVALGLTRIGDVDRHTTPLAQIGGTAGVVIQALAADNILTGRALVEPAWMGIAARSFAAVMALLALFRFACSSIIQMVPVMAVIGVAPLAASWAAFEFAGLIVTPALPMLAAILAATPIFFGRIVAVIRSWLADRDEKNRQTARLDILNRMQSGSLPFDADFSAQGVATAAICRPSREVGGDFFELMEMKDGRILGAVGDVMGKDVNASLVSVISKTISGVVTSRTDGELGDAFAAVSGEFLRLAPQDWLYDEGGFVTLVAARIDPATGMAEFATAGADTPIVVSAAGEARPLDLPSVAPLGWLEAPTYRTGALQLAPGDPIIMFTDGVTEAPGPMLEDIAPGEDLEFGYERAVSTAAGAASGGAEAVLSALDKAVTAHLAGGEPIDDTTILVMTWTGVR